MPKHITIKVPGKHPQTGELTTFEIKGKRIDIDIGGQAMPFSFMGGYRNFAYPHPDRLSHYNAQPAAEHILT